VFGLCALPNILKNTAFLKLELIPPQVKRMDTSTVCDPLDRRIPQSLDQTDPVRLWTKSKNSVIPNQYKDLNIHCYYTF
jgi:hypothetical protein